ncbi:hypothetical protein DB32_000179 [Sandaracinus amylolyticus]|uniref:Uncharacterized protein n=1 Tax=Sandaracinus amylolyticus TaxID=927083 RepID=A0A0F6VYR8_9BACT|nr:hypothetical protein DB32_000179 [Sandaracinus amylolyticus]
MVSHASTDRARARARPACSSTCHLRVLDRVRELTAAGRSRAP